MKLSYIFLILFSLNCFAQSKAEIKQIIQQTSINENISYKLLLAICTVESNLNPLAINRDEPNNRRSHGLCQIQYRTAKWLGFKGRVEDLYYAKINAKWSAKYLKYQFKRYNGNLNHTIAAYNAGRIYIRNGQYSNQSYVNKVRKIMK